eukprot:scaffold1883_cov92-Amphora_coffeaeformis.AAC.2
MASTNLPSCYPRSKPSWIWAGSSTSLPSAAGYPRSSSHPSPTRSTSPTSTTLFGASASHTVN